jgi:hypothetical protein
VAQERRSSYRQWLLRFFAILLGLLAATALFNLLVDRGGVFRLNMGLKHAASSLLQGKMVAGPLGLRDERELQKLVVEGYSDARDFIAIGSSRTMPLRGAFIRGARTFFNHSVAGAGLEDFLTIIGLYRERGELPGVVILGIDPWMFNKDSGLSDAWRILEPTYRGMLSALSTDRTGKPVAVLSEPKTERLARYTQLINLANTSQNWKFFRKGKKLYITDTINIDDFVRLPDGSIYFPYNMRFAKMANVRTAKNQSYMPDPFYANFHSLNNTALFENLVGFLTAHGVSVVFLLPPFHPAAYWSCRENPRYAITLRIEDYLRKVALCKGATVIGSYDPDEFKLRGEDFFDGIHGHDIVMKRLFETYRPDASPVLAKHRTCQ